MAKAPPADPAPDLDALPQAGGSYTRTDSGELLPNTLPSPQDASPADPTANAVGEGAGATQE